MQRLRIAKAVGIPSPCRRTGVFAGAVICCLAAMLLLTAKPSGASPASDLSTPDTVKHGNEIFHQRCALCHTQQPGQSLPFGPPNLYDVFRGPSPLSPRQAETIIVQGKGGMPAFGTVLSRSDIRCVIAYLRAK
jgi:mono/diheme cytochrome c family protein